MRRPLPNRSNVVAIALGFATILGCSKSPEQPKVVSKTAPVQPAAPPSAAATSPSTSSESSSAAKAAPTPTGPVIPKPPAMPPRKRIEPPAIPTDPVALVDAAAQAVANKRLEFFWYALPPSYQKQLSDTIHQFADNMDANFWHALFAMLRNGVVAMKERKEWMSSHALFKREQMAGFKNAWDPIVNVGTLLFSSEFCDLNEVKKLDVGQYIANVGPGLLTHLPELAKHFPSLSFLDEIESYKGATASLVKEEKEAAIVKLSRPGHPAIEEKFVKVEGKWIPERVVKAWPGFVTWTKDTLAAFNSKEVAKQREAYTRIIAGQANTFDQMAKSDDKKMFDTNMNGLLFILSAAGILRPEAPKAPPGEPVKATSDAQRTIDAKTTPAKDRPKASKDSSPADSKKATETDAKPSDAKPSDAKPSDAKPSGEK